VYVIQKWETVIKIRKAGKLIFMLHIYCNKLASGPTTVGG